MGFIVPSRVNVSSMFGIGQPSRPFVAALTVALGYGVSLAPLAGLRFLDDAELKQFVDLRADGCLLFSRMVSITIGSTCAGRDRTDVQNMSMYSLQLFLKLWRPRECDHGNDFIWRFIIQ